jgi:hypothetical protein
MSSEFAELHMRSGPCVPVRAAAGTGPLRLARKNARSTSPSFFETGGGNILRQLGRRRELGQHSPDGAGSPGESPEVFAAVRPAVAGASASAAAMGNQDTTQPSRRWRLFDLLPRMGGGRAWLIQR